MPATPDNLKTTRILRKTWRLLMVIKPFKASILIMHKMLRKNAGETAAKAIISILKKKRKYGALSYVSQALYFVDILPQAD